MTRLLLREEAPREDWLGWPRHDAACDAQVMSDLLMNLLTEDLNEELYMARQAGLGLDLFISKVSVSPAREETVPPGTVP